MRWTIPKLLTSVGMIFTLAACDTGANQATNSAAMVGNTVGHAIGNTLQKAGQATGDVGRAVTSWPASVQQNAKNAWNGKLEQAFQFDDKARILRINVSDSKTSRRGAGVGLFVGGSSAGYRDPATRGTTDALQGVTGMGPFPNSARAHPAAGLRTWMDQQPAHITLPVGWHIIVVLIPKVGHLTWAATDKAGKADVGSAMQGNHQLSIPVDKAGQYTLYASMNGSASNVVDTVEVTTKRLLSPTVK